MSHQPGARGGTVSAGAPRQSGPAAAIRRMIQLGVQPGMPQPEERTTTFTNAVVMIVLGFIFPNVVLGAIHGLWWLVGVHVLHFLFISVCWWLTARGRRQLAGVWFSLTAIGFVTFYALAFGRESDLRYFLAMIVFLQFFLFPATRRATMAAMISLCALSYVAVGAVGAREVVSLPADYIDGQFWLTQGGIIGLSLMFGYYAWATIRDAESSLEDERALSDTLLRNVLPEAVADRLKLGEATIADNFDEVSVLFADVVGFTPMSAQMPAAESVQMLNGIFTDFDEICARHGVEKIRTIGDGYMAAAGAPVPRPDHAQALARVALEMLACVGNGNSGLDIRIGINTGEAVGGIVGTTKFHYDLWGDTVNIAARMESHGEPGSIQIGPATCEALGDAFTCEPRGPIPIKGRGEIETWWLRREATVEEPASGTVHGASAS